MKAAAEELALSSPALSRRVQALERFVGRSLFERRHQAMILNGEGELLLARLAPALDALAEAIDIAHGEAEIVRLKLAVTPLFASQRLMHRLPELRGLHPELHIDIDTGGHGLARLTEGIDAAIVVARDVDPSLHSRRLDRNRIFAICARRLVEGEGAIRTPTDLQRVTVLIHRDMPETFETWREGAGLPPIEPMATDFFDSGQLMLDAAAQGLGVAFMHESHFDDAHDERLVRLFDYNVASPYSYWFACRRSALARRPVRIFHDWIMANIVRD